MSEPDPTAPAARRPLAVLQVMGCRLNHAEAARIRGALEAAGWTVRTGGSPKGADAYLLHSCAVTGAAQTEALRHVRAARRAGVPEIVASGCAANVAAGALREAGATRAVSRLDPAPPVPAPDRRQRKASPAFPAPLASAPWRIAAPAA